MPRYTFGKINAEDGNLGKGTGRITRKMLLDPEFVELSKRCGLVLPSIDDLPEETQETQ